MPSLSQEDRKKKLKLFGKKPISLLKNLFKDAMKTLKMTAETWKKLAQFAEMTKESSWEEAAEKLAIPRAQARRLMVTLQDSQKELMALTGETTDVYQAWNWTHWCQLTQVLEQLAEDATSTEVKKLVVPLLKEQRLHPAYPVYVQLRQRWQEMNLQETPHLVTEGDDFTEHKINIIESCLLSGETVLVEWQGTRILNLIPCRLAYLEGELSLIAEETHDHGLLSLRLSEIQNIKRSERRKDPRATHHEITEFISALRAMSDNETRLVLKIKNPDQFKLIPDHQFLGKPCLVTNPEGDLIWAAWVEPSDQIFAWLMAMEDHAEILEPSELILDYAAYCEENRRKMA